MRSCRVLFFLLRFLVHHLFVLFGGSGAGPPRRFTANVCRRALDYLKPLVVQHHEPAVAKEHIAHVVRATHAAKSFWRRRQVAHIEADLRVTEIQSGLFGVGRLLVVFPGILAASRRYQRGPACAAQAPGANIHLVHTLVADVAVAGVPEPVPVVCEFVLAVRFPLRGAKEFIPIKPRGHRLVRRMADGEAPSETKPAGVVNLTDHAFAQQLHCADFVRE